MTLGSQSQDRKTPLRKRQELTYYNRVSVVGFGNSHHGCAEAAKPAHDAAMEASTARMIVASGDTVPGHSQYFTLGKVQAQCMESSVASYITVTDIIADGKRSPASGISDAWQSARRDR